MAPTIEDRYLWLGLGVFTFIAVKAVAHGLRHIVSLTEVHNSTTTPLPPSPHHLPPANPFLAPCRPPTREDTIKTSSLSTLATCTNIEIRRAATKILCDRFMANPSAGRLLLKDLQSNDVDTVHRARLALNLLEDYEALNSARSTQHAGGRSAPYHHHEHSRNAAWGSHARGGSGGRAGAHPREDLAGRDPEERELRRRRREAMVLNEGDRPVSQEDVWMRDMDGEAIMAIEESWDDRM